MTMKRAAQWKRVLSANVGLNAPSESVGALERCARVASLATPLLNSADMPASAENFVAAEPTPAEPKSRSNGSKFSVSSNVAPAKEYPSLKELSDSLPPSVFQSSLTRAMLYVAFDTAVIIGLCAVQYFSFHQSPYFWHAYPVYAFLQVYSCFHLRVL